MSLPKTYKVFAKLLIEIAEHGNDYRPPIIMTHTDQIEFGNVIADIQNWLGENRDLLDKLKLEYNSTIA